MQYILTQQEMDDLRRIAEHYILAEQELKELRQTAKNVDHKKIDELQELCSLAAKHIPVVVSWNPTLPPRPWGCILGPKEHNPAYCDDCPAQKVCPSKIKRWSK